MSQYGYCPARDSNPVSVKYQIRQVTAWANMLGGDFNLRSFLMCVCCCHTLLDLWRSFFMDASGFKKLFICFIHDKKIDLFLLSINPWWEIAWRNNVWSAESKVIVSFSEKCVTHVGIWQFFELRSEQNGCNLSVLECRQVMWCRTAQQSELFFLSSKEKQ